MHEPLNSRVINTQSGQVKIKEAAIYVTEGCPYECTFCATPELVKGENMRRYVRPSIQRILDEVEYAVNVLGATGIHFVDDLALITEAHYREFIQGIKQCFPDKTIYWRLMARASTIEHLPDEVLKEAVEAGCWRITMGVESGNDNVLKRIKKRITKEQVRNSVTRLRDAGLRSIKGFFIMGFPGESKEEIMDTRDFIFELRRLGLTDIGLFQFIPWPGTVEYQRLKEINPDLFERLSYLRGGDVYGGDSSMSLKKQTEMFFLPQEEFIAQIPCGEVESLVRATIDDFYTLES